MDWIWFGLTLLAGWLVGVVSFCFGFFCFSFFSFLWGERESCAYPGSVNSQQVL